MKGLMVALLTLLTASFATAQEDDGGTFVLRLNEENFQALLRNEDGLIANIPRDARGNVSQVVVKLEDAVRNREIERMTSTKPGLEPSSQVPSLDLGTTARRPSVTQQDNGFRNPIQNRTNDRGIQPSIQIPYRAPERFAADQGFEQVNQPARTNTQPFLRFGDDSDFAPVVNRDWLTRQQATLDGNDGLRQVNNVDGFRQRNNGLGQVNNADWQRQRNLEREPSIPTFDRNRFQTGDRDRTNDLARGDLQVQDRNNIADLGQLNQQGNGLLQKYQDTLRDTQDVMNNQQLAISQKDAEIEKLRLQILRERTELANRQSGNNVDPLNQSTQNDGRRTNGSYPNYQNNLTQTGYDTPQQNRIARNDRQPVVNSNNGVPTLQIQGNDDQASTGDASKSTDDGKPIVNSDLLGKNQSLRKANNFLLFMLLASIGLNVYLGLISRTFYTRYEELADELRETFTATM